MKGVIYIQIFSLKEKFSHLLCGSCEKHTTDIDYVSWCIACDKCFGNKGIIRIVLLDLKTLMIASLMIF